MASVLNPRSAGAVDRHVAAMVRLRRMALGLSQQRLAETVGVSFQQVQKYERATSRISAGRLFELSRALKVRIGFFFEGMEKPATGLAETAPVFRAEAPLPDGAANLLRAYSRLADPILRNRVTGLVRALAESLRQRPGD